MNKVIFQYISDLHLETRSSKFKNKLLKKIYTPIENCYNLFLLGDISNFNTITYENFINDCSSLWKNVFVVFGNHEFYNVKNLKNIENINTDSFPANVYFLQNSSIYLNKITNEVEKYPKDKNNLIKIIGSTLWSNITDHASEYMNDYYLIKLNDKLLTPDITRGLFFKNKDFILNELEKEDTPTILLTHHGVHNLTNGPFIGGNFCSAFATDIPELKKYEKHLIACINGHTHVSLNTTIPNTKIKLLSNCYGYKKEPKKQVKFDLKACLEI